MSEGREIRCYDYVNHPYERVRDALMQDALSVFQSATKSADSRAQSIAAELHVDIGGIGVMTDTKISVKNVEEKDCTQRCWCLPLSGASVLDTGCTVVVCNSPLL